MINVDIIKSEEQAMKRIEREDARLKNFLIASDHERGIYTAENLEFYTLRQINDSMWTFWKFTPNGISQPDRIASGFLMSKDKNTNKAKYLLEIPDAQIRKNFSKDAISDLQENKLMLIHHNSNGFRYFLIPTSDFIAKLMKCLNGTGQIFRDVPSLYRDLFIADCLLYYAVDNDLIFIAKGSGNCYRLHACVTRHYQALSQTIIKDVIARLPDLEFVSCQVDDKLTMINYKYPEKAYKGYCPGVQFVFSDTTHSSTLVRSTISVSDQAFVYINEKSFNHKLTVTVDDLVAAVEEVQDDTFSLKKLARLNKKKCESAKEAFTIFKKMCVTSSFRAAIGSKMMDKVFEDTTEYFNDIFDSSNDKGRVIAISYEDILIEYLGAIARFEHTDSTAEKAKGMMKKGIHFILNY